MEILDGKDLAGRIKINLKKEVEKMGKKPFLAAILVGQNESSKMYNKNITKACNEIGILNKNINLSADSSEKEIINQIKQLNRNDEVDAIIIDLPLPEKLNLCKILSSINPGKDADCITPENLGRNMIGDEIISSPAAKGIIRILEEYNIELCGSRVVIINNSIVLGRPLMQMLMKRGATISVCHRLTKNLSEYTKWADILITGAGIENLIVESMLKEGAVIVDTGIIRVGNKITGDVQFDQVKDKASYITPVTGGVGPMTVAMILENTIQIANRPISGKINNKKVPYNSKI